MGSTTPDRGYRFPESGDAFEPRKWIADLAADVDDDVATLDASLAPVAKSGAYTDLTGRPTLGGAAALNVGTTSGTVAAGNDSRLSDARAPLPSSVTNESVAANANIHPSKIDPARVTFSDTNFTVPATARQVDCLAITAPRTVTLPAASSVPAGTEILIADVSGSLSDTVTLTIARAGSDTINGATTEVMRSARSYRRVRSNGVNGWTFDAGLLRAGRNLADVGNVATARDNLGAANAATIGNLLPLNVATGTDATGTTQGFNPSGSAARESSTEQAWQGSRSLKVTLASSNNSIGVVGWTAYAQGTVPVVAGRTYTFSGYLYGGTYTGSVQMRVYWWQANGSASAVRAFDTGSAVTATSAWRFMDMVAVAPSDAASASMIMLHNVATTGATLYYDGFAFYQGAGGLWTVPGVPIPNLGLRVSPSNSAVMQAWNDATNSWVDLASGAGVVFGTTAGTATEGNDSRVVNAVQTSRQVATGSGLTGGGNLTADRTLAVDFTAVATAAQGTKADSAVQPTIIDAKGDLLVGTANDTVARLPVGTNGHVLTVDSAEAGGVKWAAPLLPRTATISALTAPSATSGAWQRTGAGNVIGGGWWMGTSEKGHIEFPLLLDGGTYSLTLVFSGNNSMAIATFSIDGTFLATVDTYTATSTSNQQITVIGLTVPGGHHTLRVAALTRRADSGGWNLFINGISLVRTGA